MEAITIADDLKFLRQISKEVNILNDKELINDIKVLDEYCKEHDVMAMAAVQLGIAKRIVYLKNTNLDIIKKMQVDKESKEERQYNECRVLINPVIVNREGLTEYWESCASCLNHCGRVLRPYKIEVEYYDINGKLQRDSFIGFESTVLSHEMDHLDGILHMDIAEEVKYMPQKERKVWRQTHEYKIYSKTQSFDQLKPKVLKRTK